MGLSMKEKRPITREFAIRYRAARTKAGKSRILTDFTAVTGYNRKYAIGILGSEGKTKLLHLEGKPVKARITHKTGKKRVYQKYYDPDVAAGVIRLWEFFRGYVREAPGSPHQDKHHRPRLRPSLPHHGGNPAEAGSDKPFHRGTDPQRGTEETVG
jgi:hypothetical protein